MDNISIAIDGPAGAGKSTIARKIAEIKNIIYIDTGAMYRAITLKLLRKNVDLEDIKSIKRILEDTQITITDANIYLDGINVEKEIRTPEVSENVSKVAALPFIREKMVKLQREIASKHDVIMDGRDIGTRVLKDAKYKIFLTASIEERAIRRHNELISKGYKYTLENVINDISTRDRMDTEREMDPLRIADDAILIDTSGKTVDNVIEEILALIK